MYKPCNRINKYNNNNKTMIKKDIACEDGTVLNVAANDKQAMAAWMLAIDGSKHNFSFNSSMDPKEKVPKTTIIEEKTKRKRKGR